MKYVTEDGRKYVCKLIVPQRYLVGCINSALLAHELESADKAICQRDAKPYPKGAKSCGQCADAYAAQLSSATKNAAQAVTPAKDRFTQSAIVQANAGYASCWARAMKAGSADCSQTCAGRMFVSVVLRCADKRQAGGQ